MLKQLRHTLAGLPVLLLCISPVPAWSDTTYVIIRHGEKPPAGLGQLNCRGLNRALALPTILLSKFGKPAGLFAPNPAVRKADKGVPYFYIRPLATIEPLAIRLGMPVDISWPMAEVKPLADELLKQPEGTYVIAWEHHLAVRLTQTLLEKTGANPDVVPAWPDDDFDSIYIVRRPGTASASFAVDSQGLHHLPETCPDPQSTLPSR